MKRNPFIPKCETLVGRKVVQSGVYGKVKESVVVDGSGEEVDKRVVKGLRLLSTLGLYTEIYASRRD